MARSSNRRNQPLPPHLTKARVVEEVVALLHELEGDPVERNVSLPSTADPSQFREIDVLITGELAGHPIRIPIECKNYSARIDKTKIAEFADKLKDVGIPTELGVFVSVSDYEESARRRAKQYGIKLLRLEGFTSDRLTSAAFKAFRSTVDLLMRVEKVTFVSGLPIDDIWNVFWIKDRYGNMAGGLWDLLWKKWINEEIPATWGLQNVSVEPPKGWSWHFDHPQVERTVVATVRVLGFVITEEGLAHRHVLQNVLNENERRRHIRAIFEETPEAMVFKVVSNKEEYQAATHPAGIAHMVYESLRAPRIEVHGRMYWPPTKRAIDVIQKRIDAAQSAGNLDWADFRNNPFEELEGTDINAIWSEMWSGHPASKGEDWPKRFGPQAPRPVQVNRQAKPRINPKKRKKYRATIDL